MPPEASKTVQGLMVSTSKLDELNPILETPDGEKGEMTPKISFCSLFVVVVVFFKTGHHMSLGSWP